MKKKTFISKIILIFAKNNNKFADAQNLKSQEATLLKSALSKTFGLFHTCRIIQ